MPNVLVLEQIELAELAQSVDDGRGVPPESVPGVMRV
jgi:hypothetical protein